MSDLEKPAFEDENSSFEEEELSDEEKLNRLLRFCAGERPIDTGMTQSELRRVLGRMHALAKKPLMVPREWLEDKENKTNDSIENPLDKLFPEN